MTGGRNMATQPHLGMEFDFEKYRLRRFVGGLVSPSVVETCKRKTRGKKNIAERDDNIMCPLLTDPAG